MICWNNYAILKSLPCWPVKVPQRVGTSFPTRLPAPGVITRLSPAVHTPVVSDGWPRVVETKSSLIWHISKILVWLKKNSPNYFVSISNQLWLLLNISIFTWWAFGNHVSARLRSSFSWRKVNIFYIRAILKI